MVKGLIARKIGMTSSVSEDGRLEAITLLSVGPNTVTQIKTIETDGYTAVQLGAETTKKLLKPQTGHYKKSKATPKISHEFRLSEISEDLSVGNSQTAEVFEVGETVNVSGISKGKGWAGTIKRHNFKRGRKTHGGRSYRRVGSIGSMYPQKIFKGKRMAGQMGHTKVTVRNLKIALIDNELGVIGLAGAVPGPKRGVVVLRGKST